MSIVEDNWISRSGFNDLRNWSVDVTSASTPSDRFESAASGFEQPEQFVSHIVAGVPGSFIDGYALAAVTHAFVDELDDEGWFAEVAGFDGVWGQGATAREALDALQRAIVAWVEVRLEHGLTVPSFDGFDLSPRSVA